MDDMEMAHDFGVDVDAQTITIGLLSDLTGPFGPLVQAVVAGQNLYWGGVNAAGGIDGWTVELEVRDTVYVLENHVALYEELKPLVLAFGHSTGSPHTVAIAADMNAENVFAIPLTWYSGWTDPEFNANLLHHGSPYCVESHNLLGYLTDVFKEANDGALPTLAIASIPGDYGLDSAIGAQIAAATLGLTIAYDGSGQIVPAAEGPANPDEITAALVGSGADIVFLTGRPSDTAAIYGRAVAAGFEAMWTGASVSFNTAFLKEGSPIRDAMARDYYASSYYVPWGANEGVGQIRAAVEAQGLPPSEYYTEGWVEAMMMHAILTQAIADGDLTRVHVLEVAKGFETMDFGGIAPTESYVGTPNEQLQRVGFISRLDPDDVDSGGTGYVLVESEYTHQIAADLDFTGACYDLRS